MKKNITKKMRMVKEAVRAVLFLIIILSILTGWVLVSRADTSLYMDVTVTSIEGTRVTFMNEDGHAFDFVGVIHPFRVGDKTVLEVGALYDHDIQGFRIITMYVMVPDKREE